MGRGLRAAVTPSNIFLQPIHTMAKVIPFPTDRVNPIVGTCHACGKPLKLDRHYVDMYVPGKEMPVQVHASCGGAGKESR